MSFGHCSVEERIGTQADTDNMYNARYRWTAFWMRRSGMSRPGRIATWLATLFVAPYKGRIFLARLSPAGYVSVQAGINHDDLRLGRHCL